jgi:hypothetical protein
MSQDFSEIEEDEFERGERDFYISNDWGEARPDPARGARYVRGWEHTARMFDLLGQPQTIEEAIVRLRSRDGYT